MSIPAGTTHVGEFCGKIDYYKRSPYDHLNQVSEEWEIREKWYYWDEKNNKWEWVGIGFSPRRLKEIVIVQ